jgi:quercetin dioxygenase-like cupin family protein
MEIKEFGHSAIMEFTEKVEYSAEGIVSKRVLQKEKGNVSLFAFDKDQQLSEHSAPFDALIQVLDGQGRITIGGKSFDLKAGQSIIMPASVPHAVYALEKFKMLLTMIKSE